MNKIILLIVITIFGVVTLNRCNAANNGFDLTNALVPAEFIMGGGPPKDGIPALDRPNFVAAGKADFLVDSDRVLGVNYQGMVKAYPIKILNYHEIVNDDFNGQAIAITFCPLCGSGIAYSTNIDGKKYSFGVSGLLYNSDVLLYDRETQSLWSQIMNKAISGPLKGRRLQIIISSHTTWQDWKQRHPDSLVLSTDTGYRRDYTKNPYRGYELDRRVWFPVVAKDNTHHPKSLIIGIEIDGKYKGYPFSELERVGDDLKDNFAGNDLIIRYSKQHQSASISDNQGNELPAVTTFWFVWYAFHPEGIVFKAK
jgi:hypothetical protein